MSYQIVRFTKGSLGETKKCFRPMAEYQEALELAVILNTIAIRKGIEASFSIDPVHRGVP